MLVKNNIWHNNIVNSIFVDVFQILIDTNQEDRYFGDISLTNPAVIKSQPLSLLLTT